MVKQASVRELLYEKNAVILKYLFICNVYNINRSYTLAINSRIN